MNSSIDWMLVLELYVYELCGVKEGCQSVFEMEDKGGEYDML